MVIVCIQDRVVKAGISDCESKKLRYIEKSKIYRKYDAIRKLDFLGSAICSQAVVHKETLSNNGTELSNLLCNFQTKYNNVSDILEKLQHIIFPSKINFIIKYREDSKMTLHFCTSLTLFIKKFLLKICFSLTPCGPRSVFQNNDVQIIAHHQFFKSLI